MVRLDSQTAKLGVGPNAERFWRASVGDESFEAVNLDSQLLGWMLRTPLAFPSAEDERSGHGEVEDRLDGATGCRGVAFAMRASLT